MYKVGDEVLFNGCKCKIIKRFDDMCMIIPIGKSIRYETHVKNLNNNAPKPRHTIHYTVYDNVSGLNVETFSSEKEAIEKCETLNKVSINIGDIFKHSDGTAVEVVNSTLEETEVMLEIAGSVYYSKYDNQQFLKEFTKQ